MTCVICKQRNYPCLCQKPCKTCKKLYGEENLCHHCFKQCYYCENHEEKCNYCDRICCVEHCDEKRKCPECVKLESKICADCNAEKSQKYMVACMDCNWEEELCVVCSKKKHMGHSLFTHIKRDKQNFYALSLDLKDVYNGEYLTDGTCRGTIVYGNGEKYNGTFKGYKKVKGIMNYNNGHVFDGEWIEDKKEGKGIMKYKYGNVYDGEWKGDKKEGKGLMKFNNGDVYDGEWKEDKKHGKGYMKYSKKLYPESNNEKSLLVYPMSYEGDWKDDLYHGEGILYSSNNTMYKGEFQIGVRDGKGHEAYVFDGKEEGYYDGRWYLGKRHGCGIMKIPTGEQFTREYCEGVMVQSKKHHYNLSKKQGEELDIIDLAKKELETEKQTFEENKKELAIEKQKFEENRRLVNDLNSKTVGLVKINAGGTIFTTSVTTLTKYDGFLKTMFSGNFKIEKLEDGSVFLDISPEVFGHIIAFLRDPVFYPPSEPAERERLFAVAESYGMKELCDYLSKKKSV